MDQPNLEGASEYTTCANLLTASSSTWPQTAVFQIASSGVPMSKIVIGKPATTSEASNGFMSTSTLASCLQQAQAKGWSKCFAWHRSHDHDRLTKTYCRRGRHGLAGRLAPWN
jgi:hypothetical protein